MTPPDPRPEASLGERLFYAVHPYTRERFGDLTASAQAAWDRSAVAFVATLSDADAGLRARVEELEAETKKHEAWAEAWEVSAGVEHARAERAEDLLAQAVELHGQDHARGCQGREHTCTCGFDDRISDFLSRAAHAHGGGKLEDVGSPGPAQRVGQDDKPAPLSDGKEG